MAFFWNRPAQAPPGIRADARRSAEIDTYVTSQVRPDGPGLALAVVSSGTVGHSVGYGLSDLNTKSPNGPDTIFHLASCGKQFTGLGIMMLAEERKLTIDDAVSKHLPPLARYGPRLTIRHLLHHTSGIRDFYDEAGMDEVLTRCERPTNDDVIRIYAELGCPMAEQGIQPGDRFAYSNSGYDLLGAIIAHVSGQSYHDFFQQRVFDPLGMKDTFSAPDPRVSDRRRATGYQSGSWGRYVTPGGSEFDNLLGSGSFYTTTNDLCLYDRALASNRLATEASMREALTSGRTNDGTLTNYGFGWMFGTYQGMRFAEHEGEWIGFYSYIGRSIDRSFSIFALSNHPGVKLVEVANAVIAAARE
jgi:CubicO group peptidase (beta-lactamase class C family)